MIYGIGTDLALIERFDAAYQRHGERFARKLLADEEWSEFVASLTPGRFLAKRFAAKEALGKAMGTGIRFPAVLGAMAVTHDALGRPAFLFSPELAAWLKERHLRTHLSLSDEQGHALAFVVLETVATEMS